ncbi:putative ribonuclease H-like domain-containing protein [Tanacetum coccineum]
MKPLRCPITILNTMDHLGKFDGKPDEGFFVGYSVVSRAMRVFNKRTRIVEETLNNRFLENTPNMTGNGPNWLFDVDNLTISMNYVLVVARNQTNSIAGTRDNIVTGQAEKKTNPEHKYILIPFCTTDPLISQGPKDSEEDSGIKPTDVNVSGASDKYGKDDQASRSDFERLLQQEKIFSNAYDDEDVGADADRNNLKTTMNVCPIPTTRIDKDHPKDQIIGELNSAIQTRRMTKISNEHAMVFRNKKDDRGIVIRNKARLVAQGYTQEEGIDYDEVFALVARIEAIRLFLAYASFMGFIVYQIDVKSSFLYGTIEEEVYVCQTPGFEDPHIPEKVYKIEKALYGLHQAPRAWYETLSTYLIEIGFSKGTIDKTLFIKKTENGIFISQDKYMVEILKKFDFSTMKTARTPMEPNKALVKDEEVIVWMFQDTPNTSHIHVVKRIFRYLKGQHKLGLWYPRDSPFDLEAFSDCDYAGANLDRKSTIGGCQFLGKRLISWKCKKQTKVANSTTKAEYAAAVIVVDRYETVYKEWEDRMERAATTTSSLDAEQDSGSGPRCHVTILGNADAQTRIEAASKQSNDPPLLRGYTLGSGEDSMKLLELMEL